MAKSVLPCSSLLMLSTTPAAEIAVMLMPGIFCEAKPAMPLPTAKKPPPTEPVEKVSLRGSACAVPPQKAVRATMRAASVRLSMMILLRNAV